MDIFWWTRHDEHGYCSNFFRTPIEVDGVTWPTVEHYYQAMKTLDGRDRERIRSLETPKEAKFMGYHIKIREDWEQVKEEYMLKGLRAKFSQYKVLRDKLLSTGDAILHENSPWDRYWGYAGGEGKDRLGQLLMQVREELRDVEQQ